MREFQLVDDVMPDVPPADHARVLAVRAEVLGGTRRRRRTSVWPRVTLAAAAVTGVLAAGAVVVPRLGGDRTGTVSPSTTATAVATTSSPTASSPEEALATAADRLAAQPPGTGAWWRREAIRTRRAWTKADPPFTVEHRLTEVVWIDRQGRRRSEQGRVSSSLPTAADRRAWKKAGSPKLCGDHDDCQIGKVFFMPMRLKQATLPEEAGALKALLLRQRPKDRVDKDEEWLWAAARWILLDSAATPRARAAVYRMLAGLPGADVVGRAHDTEGRTGIALEHGNAFIRQQLVIDPTSGDLLAVQTVVSGDVLDAYAVRRLGWTDERPPEATD
ncbi:CU044_5270 family protein [Nonomuraea rhodomycinica]|uniref:CU044_5270 family protein n=1 Tax=Nonomuraea rhodomycinica TaxID=1712872 RepID=A0A7Y6MD12_9ACTN|nr:CU044_5270 family protein [Nonomuraea rhodomycinica]NUW43968.1 CU044_5270 family protein [Nonomuraea rhodomycinica]